MWKREKSLWVAAPLERGMEWDGRRFGRALVAGRLGWVSGGGLSGRIGVSVAGEWGLVWVLAALVRRVGLGGLVWVGCLWRGGWG